MKLILENWKRYTEALGDKKESTHNELLAQKALEQADLTNKELIYSLLVSINSDGEFKDKHKQPVDEESLKIQIPKLSKFVNYFVSILNLFGIDKDSLNKIKFNDLPSGIRAFIMMWNNYIAPDSIYFNRGLMEFLQVSNLVGSAKISDEILNQYYKELGVDISETEIKKSIKNSLTKFISQAPEDIPDSTEPSDAKPEEKLKQFQDSEFYKTIQDEEAKLGLSFIFKYFIDNQIISEGLKDVVIALGIKPADLRKALMELKSTNQVAFKKVIAFLKDENNTNAFVDVMKDFIAQPTAAPEEEASAEGETKVEVGGEEYTYTDEDIQILKKAYEAFVSDESGLMKAKTLRAQEEVWKVLRDALNNIGKFRAIAGQERSLTNENLFEQENSPQIKRLVVDLERLRKDFNDTDKTLEEYIKLAVGGEYQAKAYMARFLAELKDVQNSIAKAAADTKSMLNIKVNEVISEQDEEEESREQKIENVRNVYMKIEDLLGGILPELDRNVAAQNKEVSVNVKESYEELQKIRKYFRNVGAFAKTSDKDVGELKEEYLSVKKDIMKSMSRVIDDLRRNRLTPNVAVPFLERLAEVGSFIQDYFGVGPNEGFNFKSIDVSADDTSKEEIEADTNAEGPSAVNDIANDFDPDRANADIEAAAGERASVPTEIIDPEFRQKIPREIQKEISTLKGPISMEEVERLNKLDGGEFIDYYKRYLTLIGALKNFIKTGEEDPKKTYENLKTLQWLLRMELDEQQINEKSDSSQKSLAQIQKNALRMTNILKNKPDEQELDKFERLYQQILIAIEFLVNNPKQIDSESRHDEFVKTFIEPKFQQQIQQQNEHKLKKSSSNRTKTLIEKLVREELKVLNGKKMVCN